MMKQRVTAWMLIVAAALLLLASQRIELLLISAPLSILIGYLAVRKAILHQRRMLTKK